jgi:HEPN domain-containing protein
MKFDVEKTISYWLESAEYDLKTADSLFITEKYPYSLFFGHLAIEKLLKALVVKKVS